jgi:hypothetical protein
MFNVAFIDGQNLHMGTKSCDEPWEIDLYKLKFYLYRKHNVKTAYYFLGNFLPHKKPLYDEITKSGYILKFKPHTKNLKSSKKGNVDSNIIFNCMKQMIENDTSKIVIISGDGDYRELIDYLIIRNRFKGILFPNTKYASSLYKSIRSDSKTFLDQTEIRKKISKQIKINEKGPLGS